MSNKTVISVKVDRDVRDRAREFAREVGLPLSTIINNQLRHVVYEQRVEFRKPLVPNVKTARTLRKIDADIRSRRNMSPTFDSAEDAIRWLHAKK